MLEDVTEFVVAPDYQVRSTTYDVLRPDSDRPIARFGRTEAMTGPNAVPFPVHTGPGLDVLAGTIIPGLAVGTDKRSIGYFKSEAIGFQSVGRSYTFHQEGLGTLPGKQLGADSNLLKRRGLRLLDTVDIATMAMNLHVRFESGDSRGFEVERRAGVSNRYRFLVHAPRVSRLLLLATFLLLEGERVDWRETLTSQARVFDPGSWFPRKKPRR
ncbi:hypothetical protein [Nocardia jiangxiensis]|uniref:hypothetical protein n=1 Tax=Nocardia jiangxiensis TaxID=282685 RepID=UPI0002DAAE20|nr:hypothetical protein [Nocardia jiangxiensis]